MLAIFGQSSGDDGSNRPAHIGVHLREVGRRFVHLLVEDGQRGIRLEGHLAGQHLIDNDAQGVDVCAVIHLGALGLLG